MAKNMKTTFEQSLDFFDENAWTQAVQNLLPRIHKVDQAAVQIWFRFFPLELFRVLETVEDKSELIQKFNLQGKFSLVEQIDDSHKFLYGHRFWKAIKNVIVMRAESNESIDDLSKEIQQIARLAAAEANAEESLLIGISAVGLMTLVQTGLQEFKATAGKVQIAKQQLKRSPEQVLAKRAKDDSQGFFGFLKTVDKQWTVTWDETENKAKFKVINDEEIASGAARDQSQNWQAADIRCIEGVIPVECRSAACGTCWVGVLGGAEKLSDVAPREEKSMRRFGYLYSSEPQPLIRLACQAKAHGAVSIVIPPWNGVFGKYFYKERVAEEALEPATTSARANRTVVKEATKNQLL